MSAMLEQPKLSPLDELEACAKMRQYCESIVDEYTTPCWPLRVASGRFFDLTMPTVENPSIDKAESDRIWKPWKDLVWKTGRHINAIELTSHLESLKQDTDWPNYLYALDLFALAATNNKKEFDLLWVRIRRNIADMKDITGGLDQVCRDLIDKWNIKNNPDFLTRLEAKCLELGLPPDSAIANPKCYYNLEIKTRATIGEIYRNPTDDRRKQARMIYVEPDARSTAGCTDLDCQAIDNNPPSDGGEPVRPTLTDKHWRILERLNKASPTLIKQVDLSGHDTATGRPLKNALRDLETWGYVDRPQGKNSGFAITLKGRSLLETRVE